MSARLALFAALSFRGNRRAFSNRVTSFLFHFHTDSLSEYVNVFVSSALTGGYHIANQSNCQGCMWCANTVVSIRQRGNDPQYHYGMMTNRWQLISEWVYVHFVDCETFLILICFSSEICLDFRWCELSPCLAYHPHCSVVDLNLPVQLLSKWMNIK